MAADQTIAQTIDSTREHLLGNGRSEMNALSNLVNTTIASGSDGATLPQATIYVGSTTALPATGTVYIHGNVVAYTGLGSGTLTGASGGTAKLATGDIVYGTVLTTVYPVGGITPGTFITIDDEEMYVFATSPGLNQVTVSRGENSSTAAGHAYAARIYVNEPFNRNMIINAIIDDIRSWGPQIFQVKSFDIATIPYQKGYDLGSINPYYSVLDVLLTPWPTFNTQNTLDWKRVRWRDYQSMPTSDFPSGNGLIITGVGGLAGGDVPLYNVNGVTQYLHVIYSAAFNVDAIVSSATPEQIKLGADVGLDETEFDIPALGAAWRLMMNREARRATTLMQGEPRIESEVPPLYIAKTAQYFKEQRDGRLNDAQYRLMRMYPWVMDA